MGALLSKHGNNTVLHIVGYLAIQMKMSMLQKYNSTVFLLIRIFFSYFSLISKQLANKVEEYKQCIWEIERIVDSWIKNKVQSPQGKLKKKKPTNHLS